MTRPDLANPWVRILGTIVVALWTLISGVAGFALRSPADPLMDARVTALEQRFDDRFTELNRRLTEILDRLP